MLPTTSSRVSVATLSTNPTITTATAALIACVVATGVGRFRVERVGRVERVRIVEESDREEEGDRTRVRTGAKDVGLDSPTSIPSHTTWGSSSEVSGAVGGTVSVGLDICACRCSCDDGSGAGGADSVSDASDAVVDAIPVVWVCSCSCCILACDCLLGVLILNAR